MSNTLPAAPVSVSAYAADIIMYITQVETDKTLNYGSPRQQMSETQVETDMTLNYGSPRQKMSET